MGMSSRWRAGHMKEPVSGVFRVADWYDAHPRSSPPGTRLTGVIVADGVPPTPAETPADHHGKWVGQDELPITVDRADPTNFRVEWDQVVKNDWRATAQQRAQEAAANLVAGDQPPAQSAAQATARPLGQPSILSAFGDMSSVMEQAMRTAGIDPNLLNAANVHVQTSVDMPTVMMTNLLGAQPTTPATGVVTAVHDVTPVMPLPEGMSQADLTLDVRRPDGSTYAVTTRLGFRTAARRAALAVVGRELPVLVAANDPGRVVIDVARLNLP